jgi:hypothetical protein
MGYSFIQLIPVYFRTNARGFILDSAGYETHITTDAFITLISKTLV